MKFFVSLFVAAFALQSAPVTALRFSPDGKHLLISRSRAIEVRALEVKAKPRIIPCAFDKVMALAFSADGKTFAAAGGTPGDVGGVHLHDWPSGKVCGKWDVFEDVATCVAFGPFVNFAAGSADHSIVLLDQRREGRVAKRFEGHTKAVRGLAYAPSAHHYFLGKSGKACFTNTFRTGFRRWRVLPKFEISSKTIVFFASR